MTLSPSSTVPVSDAAAALEERLIKVVDIERIRYAHFREGSSIRELARTLHHSRTTIRRALEDPGPWTYRRTRRRPAPVMDAVAPDHRRLARGRRGASTASSATPPGGSGSASATSTTSPVASRPSGRGCEPTGGQACAG